MAPTDGEWTVARTFLMGIEADLAQSALEAAGIHAIVHRDDCGGVRTSLWLSGIDVIVRAEDAAAAREVLDAPTASVVANTPDEPETLDEGADR